MITMIVVGMLVALRCIFAVMALARLDKCVPPSEPLISATAR